MLIFYAEALTLKKNYPETKMCEAFNPQASVLMMFDKVFKIRFDKMSIIVT